MPIARDLPTPAHASTQEGSFQLIANQSAAVQRLVALQGRADAATSHPGVIQRTMDKNYSGTLSTLAELNTALGTLNPAVAAIGLADYPTAVGATVGMLDWVIEQDYNALYDQIPRADVVDFYKDALIARRDTAPATYDYDTHGDKHFPGGPRGTKFNAAKSVVNPIIEGIIQAEIGRIRADANGAKTIYYYTGDAIDACPGGHILTIQLDYTPATNTIGYHGYPDRYGGSLALSRAKGGAPI